MPGTVLGSGDKTENNMTKCPALVELSLIEGKDVMDSAVMLLDPLFRSYSSKSQLHRILTVNALSLWSSLCIALTHS